MLPPGATLHAGCRRPHLPPHPACTCGVSIYLTAHDVLTAYTALDLADDGFAITAGTATTPVIRDPLMQIYYLGSIPRSAPPAARCRSYTATTIYTDTATTFDYDLPTQTLPDLFDAVT